MKLNETPSNSMLLEADQTLNEMLRLAAPPESPTDSPTEVHEPKVHYMRLTTVKVNFPKSELQTSEDVDKYIEALKIVLADLINQNKRISL